MRPAIPETSDGDLRHKEKRLIEWLRSRGSVLIGFSGGVDSAYLACVAVEALGDEGVLAVIGRSASYPEAQWAAAREVARGFGVPVAEVDTDELSDERYTANPTNRCYFCKTELWSRLVPIAAQHGLECVIDGSNADDLADYRPGARAAAEWNVLSPLALLGFTKREIRALSRQRGIPTWRQPSAPCLSSRIPYGTAVTPERLRRIETAEASLRAMGLSGDLRVRYHGELARIELPPNEVGRWLEPVVSARLRRAVADAGFERVAIDARGFRSGSLNVLGGVVADAEPNGSPREAPAA
ncbi:MAG TPA: ATP-dependent sacrificial sulfur transferase LarE [Gemmatimonadaceae bacterium]|nr:ATP-dependent sacrificial sulfur transferase LarE [Gemmatimonadaceae bacterium]